MVQIESIELTNFSQWLRVTKKCEYATFFHTPYWFRLFGSEKEICARTIKFSDKKIAVIPLLECSKLCGFIKDYFCSPCATYGGWISEDDLSNEHKKALFKFMLQKKNLIWRENPLSNTICSAPPKKYSVKTDYTHMICLKNKSIEEIHSAMSQSHKRSLKKALRQNIQIIQAQSVEHWKMYYHLYELSLNRWKEGGKEKKTRTIYPWSLFEKIIDLESSTATLWLAMFEEKAISGMLCFYWNSHAVYWHGASDSSYFSLRPNNLLYWRVICDAAERGYKWFDFNPSGGYSGVQSFKEQFGAQRCTSRVFQNPSLLRKNLTAVRKAFL
ncbi:GNAT family N-acetyltransferase [Chitinispirillales bacterium ANBcel5]|uniref:GNAT family N-acetyltransferase n=1 Tax=Cellulosispirillum alkaliphilum TaxID=3039283 RepID=UPI002A4E9609|nr:GNAT family N-acetyltransferase [Chitinispirillales bacterium ANBcel5]